MTSQCCPACNAEIPGNLDVCGQCGWHLCHSSLGEQGVAQPSLHEAMRHSVMERASTCTTDALALRPAESCYGGLAVALVSDTSLSMISDGKIEASSDAEFDFVRYLDTPETCDRVWIGEVLFNSDAHVEVPLQPLSTARNRFRRRSVADCDGGTNVKAGLKLAQKEFGALEKHAVHGRVYRLILLLSDGCANEGGDPLRTAGRLKKDRLTRIVTVGFGPDRDEEMLREIASPGLYFAAPTPDVLRNLFVSFQQAVSSSVTEGSDPADYL